MTTRRVRARRRVFHRLPDRGDLLLVELEALSPDGALEPVQRRERLAEDRRLDRRDLDQRHVDVPLAQLQAERVRDRPHPELRRAVGAVDRQDEHAADRPDVDDPSAATPDERHERLDHRDRPEQVDLQLLAEVGHRLELDRRRHADARVVDEAGETALARRRRPTAAAAAEIAASSVTSTISGVTRSGASSPQRVAVGVLPDTGEDVESLVDEVRAPSRRRCRWTSR